MPSSIKDVAGKAGVSIATVSHVVNGTRYVSEETKARVYKAMKELQYTPNSVARSLRSRKSKTIGFLIPDFANTFYTSIAEGIQHVLRQKGYQLILGNSNEELELELEQLRMFNSQLIDGLIIASTASSMNELEGVLKGDYPVVHLDRIPQGCEQDRILVNNDEAVYEAVSELIQKGHSRIGMIGGLDRLSTTKERIAGYRRALEDAGIAVKDSLIRMGNSKQDCGYELTRQLCGETDMTALFVSNNQMTLGALAYLKEHRYRMPEQLSLIGFDDYEWSFLMDPPLSVIHQPCFELGETAANVLLERIGQPLSKGKEYMLRTMFVRRNSF